MADSKSITKLSFGINYKYMPIYRVLNQDKNGWKYLIRGKTFLVMIQNSKQTSFAKSNPGGAARRLKATCEDSEVLHICHVKLADFMGIAPSNKFIDADTGKIIVSSKPVVLRVMAIGSCVVVALYDRYKKIGGLAHIMLPGRSPKRDGKDKTKYAEDAIDILLDTAKEVGAGKEDLEVNVVGGANVLGEGSISEEVVGSALGYLKKLGIEPRKKRLGGAQRRSVSLDIESGRIFYTEGDSMKKEL